MKAFFKQILSVPPTQRLAQALAEGHREINLAGLVGALPAITAAAAFETEHKTVLYIASSIREAEGALDDLTALLGAAQIAFYPPSRNYVFETVPLGLGPKNERTDVLIRLIKDCAAVIVTLPEALFDPLPTKEWLELCTLNISVGAELPRSQLLRDITQAGYQRETLVESQGQFAVRGALIDLFPFGHEHPLRIEFDGDSIVSVRWFDPVTQRTSARADEITLLLENGIYSGDSSDLLHLLEPDAIACWSDEPLIERRLDEHRWRIKDFRHRSANASETAEIKSTYDIRLSAGHLKHLIHRSAVPFTERNGRKSTAGLVQSVENPTGIMEKVIDFRAQRPQPNPLGHSDLAAYIKPQAAKCSLVWITADTEGERDRLGELLVGSELFNVSVITPSLSGGFVMPNAGLAVFAAHEIFHRRRLRARLTRFRRKAVQFDRTSLKRGDLVVHPDYGIGRFEGLQMVKVNGQPRESLRIAYKDDAILYIPVENFGQVERFIGGDNGAPPLSKIGGADWARAKKRARKAAQDIADELVKLYAQRRVIKGTSYSPDTIWQQEMEASFEFEDTPDQAAAVAEIKRDLEAECPMDRLLCGDVGFGKTEVAVRAAFKVVQDSRQVAVLVPTTILAQQHYETFTERLAPFPVKVEVLSRFRTTAEQKRTLEGLKSGEVDIVIGTHRLLSRDVEFRRLGLLIIDEEHRFGVKHKERIKQMRANVDVLTMTATPIPRTLHMALMGARDTSQINTPPVDRLPVQTEIHIWSEELIRDVIMREVDRQGQVFFVHNRVQSIGAVKGMLERLLPGVRIVIAHGQMRERELERIMFDFMHGRYDVLVTTMIIESGLDIPNANTLIVNRADRFGLAQLYQLRGRIGRSNRQAYAYLLTPPKLAMTPDAHRRLQILAELTDLGSGLKIAMRDLEIRGAGNLLGAEQSGHINAVGFDLYTKMLEEAVRELKSDTGLIQSERIETRVDYDGPAFLPAAYIEDGDLRYWFYRRLAEAVDVETVEKISDEICDRFGKIPPEARNLIDIAQLKLLCSRARFSRLTIHKRTLTAELSLPKETAAAQQFIGLLVTQAAPLEVEFKMQRGVQLIYELKTDDRLREARSFLRHITRDGILLGQTV